MKNTKKGAGVDNTEKSAGVNNTEKSAGVNNGEEGDPVNKKKKGDETGKLKVLIAASEAMPFVKTGGLADVVGALPGALKNEGVEAAVIMPAHRAIKERHGDRLKTIAVLSVRLGWREKYLGVLTLKLGDVRYFFLDNEDYFGGEVYRRGNEGNEQYLFFSRAVVAALPIIADPSIAEPPASEPPAASSFSGFRPDVLHCNDWHTGVIPMLLKTQYGDTEWGGLKTVFTIHNLKFQGEMDFQQMQDLLGIPVRYNTSEFVEAHGCANMMKAALVFADQITTVSPTYAEEITTPEYGMGMEGILEARRIGGQLRGIINGIDMEVFDPETDPAILKEYRYSAADLRPKRANKRALREEFHMDIPLTTPVFCMITRLTEQKGVDLIREVLEKLLRENFAFVLLGSGDPPHEDYFKYITEKYTWKTGIHIGYDEEMAHRIYAGSDFLLMPSRFEPCGLSQMIAQRYGTLPIVRETGGLKDTVVPYNQYTKAGDGFSFSGIESKDMMTVIRLALEVWWDKPVLRKLRKNAMIKDNSFLASARKYRELYEEILRE